MATVKVKPEKGLIVKRPDPPFEQLPAGKFSEVPDTPFWRRRIAKGDVIPQAAGDDGGKSSNSSNKE